MSMTEFPHLHYITFMYGNEGEDEFKEKRFFSRLVSDSTNEVLIAFIFFALQLYLSQYFEGFLRKPSFCEAEAKV